MATVTRFNIAEAEVTLVVHDDGSVSLRRRSQLSGSLHSMRMPSTLTVKRIMAWDKKGGGLIQNVFPDLSVDQREFLMTGSTPEEWDAAFKEDQSGPQ